MKIALPLMLLLPAYTLGDVLKKPFTIEVEKETVTAIKEDESPFLQQQKNFTFEWDQQESIASNSIKVPDEEKFIATITDVHKLNKEDQQALGILFYRLGTYYSHVERNLDLAIIKLTMANALLPSPPEKAWTYAQIAYAYAQKYINTNKLDDKEKALFYSNKVISELYPNRKNSTTAFAYSVKGLVQANAQNYTEAQANLKTGITIYELTNSKTTEPYVRAKNRLANALINQGGHDEEALHILKQTKKYWIAKGNLTSSPYAARAFINLGQAYLKTGKPKEASEEFKTAISIYTHVYGNNSPQLIEPNHLLAKAYKSLGNVSQASTYEQKAGAMSKV